MLIVLETGLSVKPASSACPANRSQPKEVFSPTNADANAPFFAGVEPSSADQVAGILVLSALNHQMAQAWSCPSAKADDGLSLLHHLDIIDGGGLGHSIANVF